MTKSMTKVFAASLLLALLAGCMPVPNNAEYYGAKRALQAKGYRPGNCFGGGIVGSRTKPPFLKCETRLGIYEAVNILRNNDGSTVKMKLRGKPPRDRSYTYFTYALNPYGDVVGTARSAK